MKKEELLKEVALFSGLPEECIDKCAGFLRKKTFKRGELAVTEGDICKGMLFLSKGEAAVQKYASNGDYVTLYLLGRGDCFGEEVVIFDNKHYPYALEALTDIDLLYLPLEDLAVLASDFPKLRRNFVRIMQDRIKKQDNRITLLSQKTVRQKVAFYLLLLSKRQESLTVKLPGSREVVSKLLALPRPSFSRELLVMESEGRIKVSSRSITILDKDLLENDVGGV